MKLILQLATMLIIDVKYLDSGCLRSGYGLALDSDRKVFDQWLSIPLPDQSWA